VKYVYIFHSLASTTAVYLRDAFRHYDYIFCAGPHQLLELRSYFDKVSQKPILVEHGYNKIDKLVKQIPRERLLQKKTILIAPSWGPSSLNESDIEILIQELIKDYRVIVRFHPMEIKKKKVFMNKIIMKFPDTNFHNDTSNLDDLINSDLLITDWSGIAIEFGLGLRKPVISINYPQKVRNKDFVELEQITFENSIRKEIGIILEREQLWNIQDHVQKLINSWQPELVRKHTESFVYNLGESVKIASDKIIEIYKSLTRV
jgi:YidC/Oxa1 family membrane protein insertase